MRAGTALALGVVLSLVAPLRADPRLLETRKVFSIRSNASRNEVVYEVLLEGGRLDLGRPIRAYWILHAKGDRPEPLSALEERLAYGVVLKQVTPEAASFELRALAGATLTVRADGDAWRAFMSIRGQECAVNSIYAAVDSRGLIPSVKYVELVGTAREGGAVVSDRIKP